MPERNLPLTPYPLLQRGEKRFISFNEQDDASQGRAKKRKIVRSEEVSSFSPRLISFPSIDLKCSPKSLRFSLSSAELAKASKSILSQVDWSKVVQDVVGKDKPDCYRDVFAEIFQTQIREILEQEERNTKISRRDCEQDEEHSQEREETTKNNTEEEGTSSDDETEGGSDYLNDSFVETDGENDDDSGGYEDIENENGSEEFEDLESENGSVEYDTENYEDDGIQDEVSV